MIYLGVLKSTATTCACVRGRVGVSECGGEVGVGSLGGSRPARNFHFRRNYTSIPYLDPVPRSRTSILYPGHAVTFRPKIRFYLHKESSIGCRRSPQGGDLAEKGSFTIVKCIAPCRKSIDILKNFPRCARPFDKNFLRKIN